MVGTLQGEKAHLSSPKLDMGSSSYIITIISIIYTTSFLERDSSSNFCLSCTIKGPFLGYPSQKGATRDPHHHQK